MSYKSLTADGKHKPAELATGPYKITLCAETSAIVDVACLFPLPSPGSAPEGSPRPGFEPAAWLVFKTLALSHQQGNNRTYVTLVPLQAIYWDYYKNCIKVVLGPPKRYAIKVVKKWYGHSQMGLPKMV